MDTAFARVLFETTTLTDDLLVAYEALRQAQPPAPELEQEAQPVAPPDPIVAANLPLFFTAIESGAVNAANYGAMWVQGAGVQGGSRNQLELPRGGHRFFGFVFNNYAFRKKITIGQPVIRSGYKVWNDRLLTWHGDNRMERINLPTASQGGFAYADMVVMFRRLTTGAFELIVTPWDSDLARAWRQASGQRYPIPIGARCYEPSCRTFLRSPTERSSTAHGKVRAT
jgi:hypothetical protein